MQTFKPVFKERELKIYESLERQFLESFNRPGPGNPKSAFETCDLHLSNKQPFKFVTPVGEPTNEITWDEPIDKLNLIAEHERKLWFFVFISATALMFCIYYFWGF